MNYRPPAPEVIIPLTLTQQVIPLTGVGHFRIVKRLYYYCLRYPSLTKKLIISLRFSVLIYSDALPFNASE